MSNELWIALIVCGSWSMIATVLVLAAVRVGALADERKAKQILMEEPFDIYRDYPIGKYRTRDLIGPPHPSNVTVWEEDGRSVMVTYALGRERGTNDGLVSLLGYKVRVWHPDSSIISCSRVVDSIDDIRLAIEELKEGLVDACLHVGDNKPIPTPWRTEHRFECRDCGETWGYDSSG